jgi:hypothetical protein
VLADSVKVADTTMRRLRGLLGRKTLRQGEGLLLRPAWSIHTAFMHFPIDVVFVDHDQVVLRIEHSMRSFKTASCRGAREVVELPAGECARLGLEIGDRITWAPRGEPGVTVLPSEGFQMQPARLGPVIVASADPRFTKLARFFLDQRSIDVLETVSPEELSGHGHDGVQAVVLDLGERVADGLRIANAEQARWPGVHLVLVASDPQRAPAGVRIFDRWEETEQAIDAVEKALRGDGGGTSPLLDATA